MWPRRLRPRLHLVRTGGVWRIEPTVFLPKGTKPGPMADLARRMNKMIEEAGEEIGKPGVTAEDIDKLLAKKFGQLFGFQPDE